jgi:phospholipase/carboxylesterase
MQLHDMKATLRFGISLARARTAIVMLHGRGSSAEDIAGLADNLAGKDCAFLVPSARQGTWYPQRFMVPTEQNEPWLSSGLAVVDQLFQEATGVGLPSERVGLVGFSQGGCLALEYAARNPRRYALVAGLSSALLGPIDTVRPAGDLHSTPVLLGCAAMDPHIPLDFVEKSATDLTQLNAAVTKQIYPGTAHTVFPAEIEWLNRQMP